MDLEETLSIRIKVSIIFLSITYIIHFRSADFSPHSRICRRIKFSEPNKDKQ